MKEHVGLQIGEKMDVPLKGVIVYDSHTCASFRDGFATLNPKP